MNSKLGMLLAAVPLVIGMGSQIKAQTFFNPCERGPLPNVNIINDARLELVSFLQHVRPTMPNWVANQIAVRLCDDMSLVNDSHGLTSRLNHHLREYGY